MPNELLYDHRYVGHLGKLCRDIQKRIDDGDCRIINLPDEKERTEQKPEVFGEENGIWQTRQYIGLLEYGRDQITIVSRFDRTNPQPFFLWYLIEDFLGESMVSLEGAGGACQKNLFDELLIVRLAIQLQKAFKKGGLRAYNSVGRKWSEMLTPPDAVRDNVCQILGYMLALNCSQGGVIFPSHIRRDPVCDPVGPPGLAFWRIPVCIPRAERYEDFWNRLDEEFLRLREQMPVCRIVSGHPVSADAREG